MSKRTTDAQKRAKGYWRPSRSEAAYNAKARGRALNGTVKRVPRPISDLGAVGQALWQHLWRSHLDVLGMADIPVIDTLCQLAEMADDAQRKYADTGDAEFGRLAVSARTEYDKHLTRLMAQIEQAENGTR